MATYIVGYDLRKPGQDYQSLFDAIKSVGTWWHHLDSTWVVVTNLTATQVRDQLMAHIDANDKLLVVQSAGIGAWYGFNDNGTAWLKQNL